MVHGTGTLRTEADALTGPPTSNQGRNLRYGKGIAIEKLGGIDNKSPLAE